MLEADVNLLPGKNNTPMMAHKPNESSDLSLDEFLKTIVEKKGKQGIKLDFKSIDAFNASLPVLNIYRSKVSFFFFSSHFHTLFTPPLFQYLFNKLYRVN